METSWRLPWLKASSAPLGRRRSPKSWPLGLKAYSPRILKDSEGGHLRRLSGMRASSAPLGRKGPPKSWPLGTCATSAASAASTVLAQLVLNTRGRLARTNAPASTQSDWHAEPDAKSSSLIARHPHASPSWATLHARECTRPALPPLVIRTMRTPLRENTSTSTSIGTSTSAGTLTGTLKSTL